MKNRVTTSMTDDSYYESLGLAAPKPCPPPEIKKINKKKGKKKNKVSFRPVTRAYSKKIIFLEKKELPAELKTTPDVFQSHKLVISKIANTFQQIKAQFDSLTCLPRTGSIFDIPTNADTSLFDVILSHTKLNAIQKKLLLTQLLDQKGYDQYRVKLIYPPLIDFLTSDVEFGDFLEKEYYEHGKEFFSEDKIWHYLLILSKDKGPELLNHLLAKQHVRIAHFVDLWKFSQTLTDKECMQKVFSQSKINSDQRYYSLLYLQLLASHPAEKYNLIDLLFEHKVFPVISTLDKSLKIQIWNYFTTENQPRCLDVLKQLLAEDNVYKISAMLEFISLWVSKITSHSEVIKVYKNIKNVLKDVGLQAYCPVVRKIVERSILKNEMEVKEHKVFPEVKKFLSTKKSLFTLFSKKHCSIDVYKKIQGNHVAAQKEFFEEEKEIIKEINNVLIVKEHKADFSFR